MISTAAFEQYSNIYLIASKNVGAGLANAGIGVGAVVGPFTPFTYYEPHWVIKDWAVFYFKKVYTITRRWVFFFPFLVFVTLYVYLGLWDLSFFGFLYYHIVAILVLPWFLDNTALYVLQKLHYMYIMQLLKHPQNNITFGELNPNVHQELIFYIIIIRKFHYIYIYTAFGLYAFVFSIWMWDFNFSVMCWFLAGDGGFVQSLNLLVYKTAVVSIVLLSHFYSFLKYINNVLLKNKIKIFSSVIEGFLNMPISKISIPELLFRYIKILGMFMHTEYIFCILSVILNFLPIFLSQYYYSKYFPNVMAPWGKWLKENENDKIII